MIESDDMLELLQDRYRQIRGTRRTLRASDRLYEDLGVDSLLASELLIALEDRYRLRLLDDPRVWKGGTVAEMLAELQAIADEQQGRAVGPPA